ncbi:MAG: TonB-dependent receptor [Limnobacter sp.]|uniref:TonB-dependent receptor n=1 Tax=Limnobacter sp. TaxID=2003368 RepID=UPI003918B826
MPHIKQPKTLRTATASAVALSLAGLPAVSTAQEVAQNQLEPVIVQDKAIAGANPNGNPDSPYKAERLDSSKFARPVAETPKSISVITKEAIRDSGASDLADVIRVQPGITISTGEGGNAFGDRFIIRGFEARGDVFIDGLRDPGVTSRDIFSVEQIEVSKGPSSSFAGRGTTGGAINNVTKKPAELDFSSVELSVGTDNKRRAAVDLNRVLSDDTQIRLNAMTSDRNIPGRGEADESKQGVAFAIAHRLNSDIKLTADYYYYRLDKMPDGGVPWDSITGKPVPGRNYYGQNGRDFLKNAADIFTFGVDWNLGDGSKIENRTRYGVTTNQYVITIPGLGATPAPAAGTPIGVATPGVFARATSQNRNQDNTYFGNQTNWIKEFDWGKFRHHVVVGAEFSKENALNIPYADTLRSPNAGNPQAPNNNAWLQQGGTLGTGTNVAEVDVSTLSVYALDTVKLNSEWEVFSGLRYDTFDYYYYSGPNDYQGNSRGGYKDGFLNGHVGATYSPWLNGNVYASYSTSSNASGEQLDATSCDYGGLCGTGAGLKPEHNESFELGTKWQFLNKRLLLSAAVFDITKSNVLSAIGGGGFTQIGKLQVRGFELGASGQIQYGWDVNAGLAILDTEVLASDTPAEVGKPFPNVAQKSANVQTRYRLDDNWSIGGTVTYKGQLYGGTPNGTASARGIDSSVVLDFLTEYRFSKDLRVRLNIQNLLDEEYYTALYRSNAPFTYVGEGRSATLTLIKDF